MTGWGAHGLDQVQWALGMDETGPVEIWTEGPKFNPPTYTQPEPRTRGDKICSSPMIFYRYAGGVTFKLDNGNPGGAIFVGDQGKIEIFRGRVVSNPPEIVKQPIKDSEIRLYKSNDHVQNWIDCIRSREKPIADVEIGARTVTVCHLGNLGYWYGRRLKWDPKSWRFDNDEDNKLMDRARRDPWQLPKI